MIGSFINLIFFNFIILCSIIGFGKLLINLLNLNSFIINNYKSLEFYLGLVFLGCIGIIINFFFPIYDLISISILSVGFFIFIFLSVKEFKNNQIFYFLFVIILISVIFAYFSVFNDDFDYHFNTIENFKEIILLNDLLSNPAGGNRVSYNSHWLMINSVVYLNLFPVTLFSITSLIYSITLFDLYNAYKRNNLKKNYTTAVYSFFVLLFLIGVLNSYKEYGTDFPGQLIIIITVIIFLESYKRFKQFDNFEQKSIFLLLFSSCILAFSIKISNIFIFILLFFIFFKIHLKIKLIFYSLFSLIPLFLWFFQNYIISKCLVWPISVLCISNKILAEREKLVIEATAKGVVEGFGELEFMVQNFNWLPIWLKDHGIKILEVYGFYTFLLILPIFLSYLIKSQNNIIKLKLNILVDHLNSYIILVFLTFVSSFFWFLEAPVHRFGIIYNLNFILIFLIPFWQKFILQNYSFYIRSCRVLLTLALLFFVSEMYLKHKKYIDRHGYIWPNVKEGNLYERIVP
tara:strand:- start:3407 stop:4957 length:1551 start_codon:yes stop_codon:yes gene_type:complete